MDKDFHSMVDEEKLKKHFKDAPPAKFKPTKKETPEAVTNFDKPSISYWAGQGLNLAESYKQGATNGQYGLRTQDIETFFKRINTCISGIIENELRVNKLTTEKYKEELKVLEGILTILSLHIKTDIDGVQSDCVKSMAAQLQGFANSYSKALNDK